MRVNFAFTSVLKNRLAVVSRIGIGMLSIFIIATSFTNYSDRDLRAKQVNLLIRQIGHRLLLQAGDSTSRVLPVTETKEGTFLLKFENEFAFSHDSLMELSKGLIPKTQFSSGFTVTVHDCAKGDIVYGFQLNKTLPDILACGGRSEPSGCYTIEYAFANFYGITEQKNADIDQPIKKLKSEKVARREVNPKPEEIKTTAIDFNIDKRTEELESVKVNPSEVNPERKEFKTSTFDVSLMNLVYGGMLALLVITLLLWRFGKILKPVPVQNYNEAVIIEPVSNAVSIGKYLFNVKSQSLLLGSEVISLTDKECKVLELLNNSFGELIPRETLMQKVWIDEGVITGRSLDMFVSKLRKKLSRDPELRITNVHGKGYKLEIPEGTSL